MAEGKCSICGSVAEITNLGPYRDAVEIDCKRCGHFSLTRPEHAGFERMTDRSLLPYLSAHIKQNSGPNAVLRLDTRNWEYLALLHKGTPVSRKLERALLLVADRSIYPGAIAPVKREDSPLIDAANEAEVRFLLEQLRDSGLLNMADVGSRDDFLICKVSGKGWERLESYRVGGIPGRCFVAMSFDHSLDEAWEKGFYPALKDECKLDPIRIDLVHHNEKICDKILAEIRMSQFLVADFTLHRAGVYFEAGFALGLGKPVIWTCHKAELGKTHFDTRQYNHIDWENPSDLRTRLRDRVIATITKPIP